MYTYQKAISGIAPNKEEEMYLFGQKYQVYGSDGCFFLKNLSGYENDWIFTSIINEEKNEFFEKILGHNNYTPVESNLYSPYTKTLEGMRKVLLAIWEYKFFKPGDKVVVVMDKLKDSDDSLVDSITVTDDMKRLENKQFTIEEAIVFEGGEYTESYHIMYKLKEDKDCWNWPYHTLKKISQSQEYCDRNTECINNKPNNRIGIVKLPTIKKLKIVL